MLWDLKSKKADYRYTYDEVRKSLPFPLLLKQLAVIPSPSDPIMYLLIKKLEIQSHIDELNCIQARELRMCITHAQTVHRHIPQSCVDELMVVYF